MTPKEKANELVRKMIYITSMRSDDSTRLFGSIECVTTVMNEMLTNPDLEWDKIRKEIDEL